MPEKVVRKKPQKKTSAKTATKKAAVKRTTTRRTTAKATETKTVAQTRKAPTSVAEDKANMIYTRNLIIGASVTFLVFIIVSVFIGLSDGGEIVVSKQVEKRLETATPEERQVIENVAQPKPKNTLPMGGLVGLGDGGETNQPAPEPAPAANDDTATTSDEIVTEGGDVVIEEETDIVQPEAETTEAPTEL